MFVKHSKYDKWTHHGILIFTGRDNTLKKEKIPGLKNVVHLAAIGLPLSEKVF